MWAMVCLFGAWRAVAHGLVRVHSLVVNAPIPHCIVYRDCSTTKSRTAAYRAPIQAERRTGTAVFPLNVSTVHHTKEAVTAMPGTNLRQSCVYADATKFPSPKRTLYPS